VLGPPWLAAAIAREARALVLVESAARPLALRTLRRARRDQRPLDVALAAGELPLRRGAVSALVIENVAGLPAEDAARWLGALCPCLRPGGRIIAADATSSDAAAQIHMGGGHAHSLPPHRGAANNSMPAASRWFRR